MVFLLSLTGMSRSLHASMNQFHASSGKFSLGAGPNERSYSMLLGSTLDCVALQWRMLDQLDIGIFFCEVIDGPFVWEQDDELVVIVCCQSDI